MRFLTRNFSRILVSDSYQPPAQMDLFPVVSNRLCFPDPDHTYIHFLASHSWLDSPSLYFWGKWIHTRGIIYSTPSKFHNEYNIFPIRLLPSIYPSAAFCRTDRLPRSEQSTPLPSGQVCRLLLGNRVFRTQIGPPRPRV